MVLHLDSGRYLGDGQRKRTLGNAALLDSHYAAGTDLAMHAHEHAHICVVLAGAYQETFGRRTEQRNRQDIIWYPALAEHAERHMLAGRHLIIDVANPETMGERCCGDIRSREDPTLVAEAWRLVRLFGSVGEELDFEARLAEFVATVAGDRRSERSAPDWIASIDLEVRERFAEPLRLGELARIAGVDPAHLARTWRRHRGMTLGDTLRARRVVEACRLLAQTDLAVAEIAFSCGFADQSHLGRVFLRHIGGTPARFRNELRK